MPFEERSQVATTLVDIVSKHFWNSDELQSLYHVEMGYETQEIPEDIREHLRHIRNKTTRHIRFVPDCLIVDKVNPDNIYYLEYKCPCLLYTSPSPRDRQKSRMPSSA